MSVCVRARVCLCVSVCVCASTQDPETEVRAGAAKSVSGYYDLVGNDRFVSEVVPAVRELAADTALPVRSALAVAVMEVAGKMPAVSASAHMLPLVMQFLRDDAAEVCVCVCVCLCVCACACCSPLFTPPCSRSQVRQKVLESLDKVVVTVGADVVRESVVPVVAGVVTDSQWRVRERVLDQLPLLAEHLGVGVFDDRLLPIYLTSYHDQVTAVRLAATRQLQPIAACLGADWCAAKLLPKLVDFYNSGANYQQRITVLYAVQVHVAREHTLDFPKDAVRRHRA